MFTFTPTGTKPLRKQLKENAIPSVFSWKQSAESCQESGTLRSGGEYAYNQSIVTTSVEISPVNESFNEIVVEQESPSISLLSEQTVEPHPFFSVTRCTATQTPTRPMFSIEKFTNDNAGIMFYTGPSSYHDFTFVLQTLVANIWITWVNFMSCQWRNIDLWPDRDVVRFFCPTDFRIKFPSTRVIIGGTECPIKKPKPPVAQQSTFSTYKNRNTIKVLAGATPGGVMSYLSPVYGGSTSDRQIVERSRLTTLCDRGDSIMADKGFNVQDIFAPYDVTINIPTFFRNKNRISGKTVQRGRKISSKGVTSRE
ncbi:uncharacterized protein LOC125656863 [Ostrea edulis]|uniref:uncharacterized protein LOC125656863 n=1 Tax=Ostrea edulis TaxID=37623 RepID=UPI0024AF3A6D|nr:uncharacterized protein LOC125656863 [Ostrea edulis]